MGGSRCCFRQCHVNTAKFPAMHFFRFPLRESERYKKWRQYAQMEHMLKFSDVRRKNTSICARHFRLECFMNYKMERLVPTAVPTIMRLSENQALDFEMDIENGVLVTLEETKFEHLIPPDGFECPLSLANDKILLEKLNDLQSQQNRTNIDLIEDVEYLDSEKSAEHEEVIIEKPHKSLVNSVEILETIHVTAPILKRLREKDEEEIPVTSTSVNNKKCRILNATNCSSGNDSINETSIFLASRSSIQFKGCDGNSDELNFIVNENTDEFVNNEEQLFLTNEVFIDGDGEEADGIEYFEIHKDESSLPSIDSDESTVQINSNKEVDNDMTEETSRELLKMQDQLIESREKNQDFEILQVKLSILEAENKKLKKASKENEEIKQKLLSLQMVNNYLKKISKEHKFKLDECCEENKKLKQDTASVEVLKAEILSKTQEINELKKLLETFKNYESKEQELIEKFNLKISNERFNSMAKEKKLTEELNVLNRKLILTQQQLQDKQSELTEVKTNLNGSKNENDMLIQRQKELEQTLNNIQNHFETTQNDYSSLKLDYDNMQQRHTVLEQKFWKLQALQNQEATVSTSLENITSKTNAVVAVNSLTKAQLFNGIKRYLCASMVSLVRMEMFGSSEREWKRDERQAAVDILRLGEMVYKYFTDEWRFRLPALRDVRNWLNQSQEIMDDEEDL